mmetsp:Transcript_16939/g.54295  ORF Transcript_16939/g.54295 Transcript_16939/m.54295 type:complete len:252 (-) Transcript_16939:271-1026(-)
MPSCDTSGRMIESNRGLSIKVCSTSWRKHLSKQATAKDATEWRSAHSACTAASAVVDAARLADAVAEPSRRRFAARLALDVRAPVSEDDESSSSSSSSVSLPVPAGPPTSRSLSSSSLSDPEPAPPPALLSSASASGSGSTPSSAANAGATSTSSARGGRAARLSAATHSGSTRTKKGVKMDRSLPASASVTRSSTSRRANSVTSRRGSPHAWSSSPPDTVAVPHWHSRPNSGTNCDSDSRITSASSAAVM